MNIEIGKSYLLSSDINSYTEWIQVRIISFDRQTICYIDEYKDVNFIEKFKFDLLAKEYN